MNRRTLACLALAAAAAVPASAQQTPILAARDLYASARYDEALAMLNGLRPTDSSGSVDMKSVEQYRSLCLLALGRGAEAETAIAAVVTADPLYQPTEAEASPRVRAAFTEVRQRLLPDIARNRYASAKATFDRKDFARASMEFRSLLALIDDPAVGGRLADLRLLVAGFVDLATAAATPPPPPKPEAPAAPPAAPPSSASVPPAAVKPVLPAARVYSGDDEGVVAPRVVKQEMPRVPANVATQARGRGLMEVVIDEQGRVISATIRSTVHPVYDTLLLAAAKDWRYQPATMDGVAVKFRKMLQIAVNR